jgi:superfamily II DNA or RNA helicase
MLSLYPHQDVAQAEIRAAMTKHKSVLLQAPCGFGKTVVLADIVRRAISKGRRTIFAVHRKELLYQTASTFQRCDIEFGYIAAGRSFDRNAPAAIASIPTLRNRLGEYPADFLIVDEAHLSMSAGWQRVIDHYRSSGAYILGCTASPLRLDNRGLGNNFDAMVRGPSVSWLIENGFLSKYRLFAPSKPDLSSLHVLGGDYRKDDTNRVMNKPSITGDAVTHWLKHASGRKTVVYCVSIEHSKAVAAQFRANGVAAVHIDGETAEELRMGAMRDLAEGRLDVITNCQLFTEGVDLSALAGKDVTIECVVNLRPTKSLALWTQIVGRALRRKTEPALILDHAGVSVELGLPDDDIDWQLTDGMPGGKKGKPEVSIRVCPNCFAANRAGPPRCGVCGTPYPVDAREVQQQDGELVEIAAAAARREARQQQGRAETFEDLQRIAAERGYRPGWARAIWNARQQKQVRA